MPELCNVCEASWDFTVEGLVDGLIKYRCNKCGQPVLETGDPHLKRCDCPSCWNWIGYDESYCGQCRP